MVNGLLLQQLGHRTTFRHKSVRRFINSRELKPELVEKTPATQDGMGRYSFRLVVRYYAQFEDTGK